MSFNQIMLFKMPRFRFYIHFGFVCVAVATLISLLNFIKWIKKNAHLYTLKRVHQKKWCSITEFKNKKLQQRHVKKMRWLKDFFPICLTCMMLIRFFVYSFIKAIFVHICKESKMQIEKKTAIIIINGYYQIDKKRI